MLLRFPFYTSSSSVSSVIDLCKTISSPSLSRFFLRTGTAAMSVTNLQSHAFAGNLLRYKTPKSEDPFSPNSALANLKSLLSDSTHVQSCPNIKVLPFCKGSPLATTIDSAEDSVPHWNLDWLSFSDYKGLVTDAEVKLGVESFVYLGSRAEDNVVYWAIDVSNSSNLVTELGSRHSSFIELRTLMVATDWADEQAMVELAIAGHGRALIQWHSSSHFCGNCGEKTSAMEAGKRQQCTNDSCKKSIYPRVDPVVIMLVIDQKNDRALLSRQSRFVPRMWSCLAGFLEPGESLEEAVKRETWEETGIEVGDVIYHSSQPWPVGPNSMPSQLMVGFFAYAKSLQITVDKEELEDAEWHSREDVKRALAIAEYKKAQKTAAFKVEQMCRGLERQHSLSADFKVESEDISPMFIPGPFAIAHHLISSWATQGPNLSINSLSASISSL